MCLRGTGGTTGIERLARTNNMSFRILQRDHDKGDFHHENFSIRRGGAGLQSGAESVPGRKECYAAGAGKMSRGDQKERPADQGQVFTPRVAQPYPGDDGAEAGSTLRRDLCGHALHPT